MMQTKVLLFDVDGTLVNTMDVFYHITYDLLKASPFIAHEEIRKRYYATSGQPFFAQLPLMIPEETAKNRERLARIFERRKARALESVRMTKETEAVLRALKEKGYTLCISGSGRQSVVNSMLARDKDLFALILGFKPPHFHKGKKHIAFVLRTLNKQKKDLVYIGDSLNDAKMAKENGIDFIGKVGTFTKEDFLAIDPSIQTISHLGELR